MRAIKPFEPSELEEVAELTSNNSKAWTVKFKSISTPNLVWAQNHRQAVAIARERNNQQGGIVVSVRQNYQAQAMKPKPINWVDFILNGGEPF